MLIRIARHGQQAVNGMQPGVSHEFPASDCALTGLDVNRLHFWGNI